MMTLQNYSYSTIKYNGELMLRPRNPYYKERLGTIGLLVPTIIASLILMLKILFTFSTKQAILMKRSTFC